jgi:anthranilate phosphoribosyltransferase
MARTLGNLGSEYAWVVHGSDGLDELTTTGATHVAELNGGQVRTFDVTPEYAGLKRAKLEDLMGGTPQQYAEAIQELLKGKRNPFRDIVLLNAGAALIVAGKATSLKDGAGKAAGSIDEGRAQSALDKLIAITNTPPPAPVEAHP